MCQSGDRLLRVTVKNTGTLDFIRTWLGASATAITLGDFSSSVFTVRTSLDQAIPSMR
jgi:hypothetical protein